MPERLSRAAWLTTGTACVAALTLSFAMARGGERQADDPVASTVPEIKLANARTTSALGRAHALPMLAPAPPKPRKRKPLAAATPSPPVLRASTPPSDAQVEAEPAYTPPPVPAEPAQPVPEPAPAPATPSQPDSPPVYFDDSG
jgi:hypothetical protein